MDGTAYSVGKLRAAANKVHTYATAHQMNVPTELLTVALCLDDTDKTYRPNLLTQCLCCRFDAVADGQLALDGPRSTVEGQWGGQLYLTLRLDLAPGLYVGSAKVPADQWAKHGKTIREAVKDGREKEVVRLLTLCLRSRMYGHQSDCVHGRRPEKVLKWFGACQKAVEGFHYLQAGFPVLAFWSHVGETEAKFYRRAVLVLEEILLCIVHQPEFRAPRRLRGGARRSARRHSSRCPHVALSTQRPSSWY